MEGANKWHEISVARFLRTSCWSWSRVHIFSKSSSFHARYDSIKSRRRVAILLLQRFSCGKEDFTSCRNNFHRQIHMTKRIEDGRMSRMFVRAIMQGYATQTFMMPLRKSVQGDI
eukprot:762497-Hanusia_phi.AAC.3